MADLARSALDRFETLLRTFIPGCIFITALMLAGENHRLVQLLGASEWRWMLAAMLVGVLLYAVHYALLEGVFTTLALRWLSWRHRALFLKAQVAAPEGDLMLALPLERWARVVASDRRARSHQRHLARQYDWLIFLYCTAYALVASMVLLACWQRALGAVWPLGLAAALCFVAAMSAELSITRKELWLNATFPQH